MWHFAPSVLDRTFRRNGFFGLSEAALEVATVVRHERLHPGVGCPTAMSKTILVIDDTRDLRDSISEALEDTGFTTVLTNDGRCGLDVLNAGPPPDLILLDLMMPGMNGFEFRREQLAVPEFAGIPTVIMTAIAFDAEQLKLTNVLLKPFDRAQLLAAIAHALK
jgi:CheY-like chemotaxis protein